ncbi:YitT family protein [Aquimarina sp. 2201CG5-10]|uniref:YitT family protein n=1 Tax=Aquimarina callyspongiae TaxID=3098150 RepID=UPI002AB38F49|nr:YitT family protein [Aquimarina sp. 2201CG5-10]MDY8135982.1 YitT family protein [Aquimarina sp. 2201CG5-10]
MKKEFLNYFFILIGCASMAFGVVGFLSPNSIAMGGTGGLAIIFNSIFKISIGILFATINIPLLLVSIKYLGKYFAIKSTIAILITSLFIDVLSQFVDLQPLSNEPLLATLYGGVAVGVGIGFIFKGGGSAGGGTIIARIITSKTSLKTGTVILILDAIVIVATGIVFRDVELALWSMISIFTTTKLVDIVLTGRPNERIVHISSSNNLEKIGLLINEKIGVNGTLVRGNNLSLTEEKHVIFVTVPVNRLNLLKQIIYSEDTTAKMIVIDASQMLGTKFLN